MSIPRMTYQEGRVPWRFRIGFGRRSRTLGNLLACHVVVDSGAERLGITLAIPWLFTLRAEAPLPLNPWTAHLGGGVGGRAEYGFWHDFYETKLEWRRVLDLPVGKGGGWERRVLHHSSPKMVYRREHYLTPLVDKDGRKWAGQHDIDRWSFILTTWRVRSHHLWIPDHYDHRFTLRVESAAHGSEEASMRAEITPNLYPREVFAKLAGRLRPV